MRTFFGNLFEKIRGHVPRYPAIALGLPTTRAALVPVVSAGKGAPTSTTHPVALWPIGSRWWRIDGTGNSQLLYVQTADGWFAVPLGGSFATAIKVDTISEQTTANGVEVDGCLIKDGKAADALAADLADEATQIAAASIYYSPSDVTAAGAHSIAHGLGTVPRIVLVELIAGHDGAGGAGTQVPTVVKGTHTTTNVVVTVTAGAKFRVLAIK